MQETKDAGIVDVLEIGFAMFKVRKYEHLNSTKAILDNLFNQLSRDPHFNRESSL
jgi:hypothetical protein